MKTILTPEQSATLIAKGISADKASEQGERIYKPVALQSGAIKRVFEGYEPIFTLADLFSLIPKTIPDEDNKPDGYHRFGIAVDHSKQWCVSYFGICYHHVGFDDVELIDCLYKMVEWLAENKLI